MASLSAAVFVSRDLRQISSYALIAGLLVIIGHQLAQSGQYLSTSELLSFDNRAYLVDRSMGFDAVSLVLATLHLVPNALAVVVTSAISLTYLNVLLAMNCVVLLHLRAHSPEWAVTLAAFMLSGLIGGVLYHVCPAVGPRYAFLDYPVFPDISALSANASPIAPEFIRNCMPSLHTTWAILIVMNTKSMALGLRQFSVVFAFLTILATLALGQHYLIDLIVAVPFSVAVQSLARSIVARTRPTFAMWIGGGCVGMWFFVLVQRVSWLLTIPGLTLAAVILTIALSVGPETS
jgi:hypothetical protein